MLRIIKEVRPFIVTILITIVLLFIQAMTELALPDYMSNIVNVGIQQNGIENAVPEVIRVDRLDRIKILLKEEDRALVESHYKLIGRENLTKEEYEKYLEKYPVLEEKTFISLISH